MKGAMGGQGVAVASSSLKRLRCLAGNPVPDDLLEAARRVDKLSLSALKALGPLLPATALSPVTRELGEQLSRFCLEHEVAEADLGHVLKLCRWLLAEATNVNLPKEQLLDDLSSLLGDGEAAAALKDVVVEHYEPIKQQLRERLLSEALRRHGNVLVDIDWRIDQLSSERNAARIDVPVALLTLVYQHADRSDRLTLQLTAAQLARLAQVAAALAQKTEAATS